VRDGAAAVDDLVARTGIDAGRISAALSSLELEGLVDSSDGLYRTTT
jgi:predicted Rossmann fold nucleotide-binding protein DprA/Smf involved in DNA uptake